MNHELSFSQAVRRSLFWFLLTIIFCGFVLITRGHDSAFAFLAGYLVEVSLSVDNLFVFISIFQFFKTPKKYQHKILFWGILGAIVFRVIFIGAGLEMIHHFEWMLYLLGGFLIAIGIRMFFADEQNDTDFEGNLTMRLLRKFLPMSQNLQGGNFFVREKNRWLATPLFVALFAVEASDIIFAIDSIPAVIAVSRDPFIVLTSNIFAILGLRSLYFLVAGVMQMFRYLHYGIALILIFVGLKMLLANYWHVSVEHTLLVIVGALGASVALSLGYRPKK